LMTCVACAGVGVQLCKQWLATASPRHNLEPHASACPGLQIPVHNILLLPGSLAGSDIFTCTGDSHATVHSFCCRAGYVRHVTTRFEPSLNGSLQGHTSLFREKDKGEVKEKQEKKYGDWGA
jgi:hypothetical protein